MDKLFVCGADALIDSLVTNPTEEVDILNKFWTLNSYVSLQGKTASLSAVSLCICNRPQDCQYITFHEHRYFERHLRMENK